MIRYLLETEDGNVYIFTTNNFHLEWLKENFKIYTRLYGKQGFNEFCTQYHLDSFSDKTRYPHTIVQYWEEEWEQ